MTISVIGLHEMLRISDSINDGRVSPASGAIDRPIMVHAFNYAEHAAPGPKPSNDDVAKVLLRDHNKLLILRPCESPGCAI